MENIAIAQQQDMPAKQAALSSIEQAEKLQAEIKTLQEMQRSIMDNDSEYGALVDERKEITNSLKGVRQRLTEQYPELIERQVKIKALRSELKEVKAEAGYQLGLFQQQTGSSVLESNSGKRYHIVNNYKVAGNAE